MRIILNRYCACPTSSVCIPHGLRPDACIHFGGGDAAGPGGAVELTDAAGTVHRYVVAETETLRGSDADALPSPYPLTIFTCTADSRHRFLARCAEA